MQLNKLFIYTTGSLCITLVLQLLGLHQLLTGVIVNALFVVLQNTVDWKVALTVGIITPIFAIFTGHLPEFLLKLIPFIILGNGLMLLLGHVWEKKNIIERILLPPVHKAAIIGLGGLYIYAFHDYPEAHNPTFLKIIALQYVTAAVGSAIGLTISRRHHRRHSRK